MTAKIAIFIARWGGWPGWMPLLVRSLAANAAIDFHLLSEAPLRMQLPQNVIQHVLPLSELFKRMEASVGLNLSLGEVDGTHTRKLPGRRGRTSDVSVAKTNDLKPLLGEALPEVVRGYAWWGYMQEDVLVGDMSVCLRGLLDRADVISPFRPPANSSGLLMLFRNEARVNRLWRGSADAPRVLSDPRYLVFDEWWGSSKDNLAAVLGRAHDAGRIRLSAGIPRFIRVMMILESDSIMLI